ncbi:hypothetical protein SAMN05216179_1919 [Gracilibacillus kekensis]|uniref:YcxB-like C-terminal domain-containing protein n=1 Tax=Gracilibacillus kekensis TaxID=1027249 RepID=A0A1M7P287_9BACI|nr:hypothetical protein SAMN05216179_1919 [Gracilibacillus kekensis]
MITKFTITEQDFVALQENLLLHSKFFIKYIKITQWLFSISVFLLLSIFLFRSMLYSYEWSFSWFEFASIILVSFLFFYFFPRFFRWAILLIFRKVYRKNKPVGILGPQTITIKEDGLERIIKNKQDFFNWEQFVKLRSDEHRYFLYLSDVQAVILKKKTTNLNDEETEQYHKLIQSKFSGSNT